MGAPGAAWSVFTPGGTSSNNIIMTDANGNQITENASGVYTDTLGVQAMTVTGSLSAAHPIPITLAYPVTLQSNSATTKTATVVLGSFTVRTNFGCSGISEYGSTTTNLINRIILGDGSSYAFTYEGTPGAKDAAVTGRLASITLPSGGVISYTYSGGCTGGINTNGTVPTLKRVTTDGTRLYTSSVIGVNGLETTTTLQDEKQNQSVFNFALANDPSGAPGTKYFYETHRTIYQQAVAPGNVLFDQTTCYNGASPCDGEQVALPITQTSTTGSFNGVNPSIVNNVYDKTFGMLMSTTQMVGTTTIESTTMTYAGPAELLSVVTQDGYGDQISSVTYKYDENQAASTANMSIPQHTTPPGAPGNQTSSHTWTGSGSSTLDTATSYWDTGMPVSTTTPNGTTSYNYDTATQAFAISTGAPVAGLATSVQYDQNSTAFISSTGYNTGQTTQVTGYDALMRPTAIKLPNSTTVAVTTSATLQTLSATNGSSPNAQVQTRYDSYGRTSQVITYNGNSTSSISWYEVDSCYDASGYLRFQSMPYAVSNFSSAAQCTNGTAYTYDALGRMLTAQNADGTAQTIYTGRAVQAIDVNKVQTITQYDTLGRIIGVCEISASVLTGTNGPVSCNTDVQGSPQGYLTTYAYNLNAHSTTITQGNQVRVFQTDAAGRTVYTSEPERGLTQYSYSYNQQVGATGLAVTRTRPAANQGSSSTKTTTTTQYDNLGRPTAITYSDGTPTKQFQYDQPNGSSFTYGSSQGLLTTASTVVPQSSTVLSSTSMGYDISGNAINTSQCFPGGCSSPAFNVTRGYTYDPVLGKRTQESYLTGGSNGTQVATNMTYSPAGELLTMVNTVYGSILSGMTNTAFGPTSYAFGNGLNGVRTYDSMGRASGVYVCQGSTSPSCSNGTQAYGMTQTIKGVRVSAMTDTFMGPNIAATYDEFNRLSGINYNNATAYTYAYDPYGNRYPTLIKGSGPSPNVSFNGNNQLTAAAGYTYDAAGNVLTDPNDSYTYDAEGNVLTVTGTHMNAGTNATYYYDALNHRVRETITGANASDTDYTFNTDGQRVGSWSATGTPTLLAAYTYWNGQPVTTYSSAGTFYSHQDLLGTKRMITSSAGTSVGNFQSFAFGDGFKLTGTDPDAAHFAQLDHDAESGTEHAQFRQYGSLQAAWMSPDPYDGSYDAGNPQSLNRYAYVLNNPFAYTDPSGQDPELRCTTYYTYETEFVEGHGYVSFPISSTQQCIVVNIGPGQLCAGCTLLPMSPMGQGGGGYGGGSGSGGGGGGGPRGPAGPGGPPKPPLSPQQKKDLLCNFVENARVASGATALAAGGVGGEQH